MMHTRLWIGMGMGLLWLCGCGGDDGIEGGGGLPTTPVRIGIGWGARSRTVGGPSSALSFRAALKSAGPDGSDIVFGADRKADPAAYTQTYLSPDKATVGTWDLAVHFFAQANGQGALTGVAQGRVTIHSDGTGIGAISTVNTITSVEVPAGQTVKVGDPARDLVFTAKDKDSAIVAVTPGSAFWSVATGADRLQLTPDGKATGLAAGTATVTARVDGKTSPAATVTVTVAALPIYAVTDLGLLGGAGSGATGINNAGQVALNARDAGGTFHAFLWQNGTATALGSLPGGTGSYAAGLNEAGQGVGSVRAGADGAFLWLPAAAYGLNAGMHPLPLDGTVSNLGAINTSGQVAGAALAGGVQHAFLWQNGATTDLGTGAAQSAAYGLNNLGQVVGYVQNPGAQARAFLWLAAPAYGLPAGMNLLGTLGGDTSRAYDLNDSGQVVGYATAGVGQTNAVAFLWQNGAMINLGSLPGYASSFAMAINAGGQVVGYASASVTDKRGFLWQNGMLTDLNTRLPAGSGWTVTLAEDINDAGQIVGTGVKNGESHAIFLTPQ